MKSDLFNETSETHDYRLAVNDVIDDIDIKVFKQLKATLLQVIYEKSSKNAVIIIDFFKHTSLAISDNIKKSCYTKVDKIIINFLFKHINNFIFYRVDD